MWLRRACIWTLIISTCPLALAQEDYLASAALNDAGLAKSWQLGLQLESDQHLVDIYLVDEQLYLATNDGYVFAVHAETGANRWLRRVTSEGYRVLQPCHSGKRVIFATPTTVLQLRRHSGEGLDKMTLQFPGGTAPTSDGPRLFLGGLDRRIYAFEVRDPLRRWKVISNGPIRSKPSVHDGNLYFASEDGSVYSCTAWNKTFRWQNHTYGSLTADLVVNDQGVFVASRDRSLYLFDLQFGLIRWQARFSGPLYESPALTPEIVFQYCPDDGLVAVNTAMSGVEQRLRWKLPRGRRLLTVDKQNAYVLSLDESILVADLEDGEVRQTIPADGFTLGIAHPWKTALYIASPDGRLFCARPRGAPLVQRDDLHKAMLPPEEKSDESETAEQVAEAEPSEESALAGTARKGMPLGGKSKVSQNFGKEPGGSAAGSEP